MKFYPQDYLYDTRILTIEERGVWMDLLCFLWNSKERGQMTASPQHLAQMVGMEWSHFEVILNSLSDKGICDVSRLSNGDVTLVSRRMSRDSNALKLNAERQERFRVSNRLRQKRAREKVSNDLVTAKKSEVRSQNIYIGSKLSFQKPTPEEVTQYAKSIDFALDGQYFVDSNEAKGWVVGKNGLPMKDWKAVVRTWKTNDAKFKLEKKSQELYEWKELPTTKK